jgi:hypothetical protein
MSCDCSHHPGVYRALVTYSNENTGEIRVKVPSVFGVSQDVAISYIGRSSSNDFWVVPKIGEQIVVTTDDKNFSNIFWMQTEPYNALATGEPMGFANRLDSVINFNNATRVFTISPVDGSYDVWVRGVKYTITSPISVTIPNTHGDHNVYFDDTGTLQVKSGFFELEYEAPVSFIYWNTVSAIMFADERHGITLDWATHEYLHRTRGAAIANGFEVSGYTTTGTGNTVADAKITIANGTFFDEDLQVDITHSATPVTNTWQQRLQGGAYIPVYYRSSAGWQKATTTQYPIKFGTTYPEYNLNANSLVQMDNNRYGIAWILATNGLNNTSLDIAPVISIMGQEQYSNISDAHEALWSDVVMTGFPSYEFRPLWKVIFQAQNGSAIKAAIRAIDDLRTYQGTAASGGTSVTALDNLVDVTLNNPTNSQVLTYNGSQWINSTGASGKNLIINGNFNINQRGYTSGTSLAVNAYGFDRWKVSGGLNTVLSFTSAPQGQPITISTFNGQIRQIIERANVSGGVYVLSWEGTAGGRVYNEGASSTSYSSSPIIVALNGTANVIVEFTTQPSSTGTLGKVQLERGTYPSLFEQRPISEELALCQRYFYKSGFVWGNVVNNGFIANNANQFGEAFVFHYPVSMRATPTLTYTFFNNDNAQLLQIYAGTMSVALRETCSNASFPYSSFSFDYTVSAEL